MEPLKEVFEEQEIELLNEILDDLIEDIVKLKQKDDAMPRDLSHFMITLQESLFFVSGLIFSNGLATCDHEQDEEGNCIETDD